MTDEAIPSFDSAAMLDLAFHSTAAGLVLIECGIRDRSMSGLPEETDENVVEAIVSAVRSGDRAAADRALHGERGPYRIWALGFLGDVSEVRVDRFGTLVAIDGDEAKAKLRSAHEAWMATQ